MIGVLSTHTIVIHLPPVQNTIVIVHILSQRTLQKRDMQKSGRKTLPLFLIINAIQK
jgi:hypothetical protein